MEQTFGLSDSFLKTLQEISNSIRNLTEMPYDQLKSDQSSTVSVVEALGSHGWTIHGNITPSDSREWLQIIQTKGEAAITECFSESDIEEMLDGMRQRYEEKPDRLYLERAIENYYLGHFTEAAFFLLALMNRQINLITPDNVKKLTKQCEEALEKLGKDHYDDLADKPLSRMFLVRDYLPSFYKFAIRIFVDGDEHNLDTGTEPDYLNRNWLMHGRMTRSVKRYECVQIINAFHTLAEIEDVINSKPTNIDGK